VSQRTAGPGTGTIGALLVEAAERLAAVGVEDPKREALVLWAAVGGRSPGEVWRQRSERPAPETAAAFAQALDQRHAGAPAAYAAGTAAFRTLELTVDARVLIPRPETEGLVELVLEWAAARGRWGTAADIGTGSGCIALSLATEGRFDRVIATDLSEDALAVAAANAARLAPPVPVVFLEGDLHWALQGEQVDVLVSNPPYVTAAEWAALDPGVRGHEPRQALVGGTDGMAHIDALLRAGTGVLKPGGLLAMEIDCRRAERALALARSLGWATARIERDLFGRERYLLATPETS
jgi:release factor glutamine methyltransferase